MDKEKIINTLKIRRKNLRKRIKEENQSLERLRYKSRHVRQNSGIGPRIGWYTDRMQELDLVIQYLDGRIKRKDFIVHLAGDEATHLPRPHQNPLGTG